MGESDLGEPAARALAVVLPAAEVRAVGPVPGSGEVRAVAALGGLVGDFWGVLALGGDDRAPEVLGAAGVGEVGVAVAVFDCEATAAVVGEVVTPVDVGVRVRDADRRPGVGLLPG